MRIDLVALDLDGTLLDPEDRVSPRSRSAIRALLEGGVRVVLVTGRGVDLPSKISRDLGLNLPIICCHGALTKDFHANRILNELPLPLVYAKPMVEYAETHGLSLALYSDESFWRLEGSKIYMDDMTGPHWREAKCFSDVLDRAPTFIRFLGAEAVAAMEREFGDLPLSFRHERWGDFVECAVLNRDASKRNALARLCADFQIPPDRVLAIGDSRNDVPMLRWAKIGIAMGNAAPEVQQSVQYVTATNAEDGVALALERFVPELTKRPA